MIPPEQFTPPKGMILFSRQHQENKLTNKQEQELKQLTEDEVDLEVSELSEPCWETVQTKSLS